MPLSCQNVHATVGDYQRNYLYKIFIENVPAVVSAALPTALTFQKECDIYNLKAVFPDRKTKEKEMRWSGEYFYIPTTENSTKSSDFDFVDDEYMTCYDFWSELKNLTGNEENQAGVFGVQAKLNIGVAKISVDKETITAYRRLVGCRVYEINSGEGLSKDGEDITKVTVNIKWDRNVEDKSMRGKTI